MTYPQKSHATQHLATVVEINDLIASTRLRYLDAYFAGAERDAQSFVHEVTRLENLRNEVERQAVAS